LDYTQPLEGVSENEIAERILAELRISVQLRKVSDVPVGVFLSGGVDSSTNAVLFSEGENERVKTFSIGYTGKYRTYQNEFHYARMIADLVKSEHHEKSLLLDDLLNFLPQMVRLQDEPIADPVCVPVYYVSKLARENGVIVAQVGEGADELFWGYPHWKKQLSLQNALNMPQAAPLSKFILRCMTAVGKGGYMRGEYLRRASLLQPIFWSGAESFSDRQKNTLLSARLKRKYKAYTSWEAIRPIFERFEQKAWEKKPLNWMSYIDLNLRLPELLLMRVDKMSMGASLEGRVPFLDHKFVELAMSIPSAVKTKNGVLKSILKKAVKGVIPEEVIDRPKQGFGVPIYEWFFTSLGDFAYQELDQFCKCTDYFDSEQIRLLFDQHRGTQIWFLLNFALWWKEYIQ